MNPITDILQRLQAAGFTQAAIEAGTGIPQPRVSTWSSGAVPRQCTDTLRLVEFAGAHGISLRKPGRRAARKTAAAA